MPEPALLEQSDSPSLGDHFLLLFNVSPFIQ